ncbi:MAG: ribonuclease P protein component [Minicystis sp.]
MIAAGARGLPRTQRIRKRPEFIRIQDSPVRVGTRHLLLLLAAAARADAPPRLGVVASRKVGCAVQRNRAKRLVREAFRIHQDTLPRGVDVVVIVRPGTHALGLADVAGELVGAVPQVARRARDLRRAPSPQG